MSDEHAELFLDHTCNSGHSFNVRGIRQARWSSFGAGRNRWHTSCSLYLILFVLNEMLLYTAYYLCCPAIKLEIKEQSLVDMWLG